jgi:formylmethanofuran dehydrogenase subunit E
LSQLWAETSYQQLNLPEEEIFTVEEKQIDLPPYAPIHESAICSACGESVMETKARLRDGEPICIACADAQRGATRYVLDGSGISVA